MLSGSKKVFNMHKVQGSNEAVHRDTVVEKQIKQKYLPGVPLELFMIFSTVWMTTDLAC
jgi:hypothetical protein